MSEKRKPKGGRVAPVATELSSARRRRARLSAGGVTAEAVALEAGVSTASVSRVLNNKKVDAELSVRVREAAARLGYQPHAAARTLASHRSHTIGAVVPTIANPNFAIGVEALQSRLAGDGYKLLLASSNYDANLEEQQVGSLLAHGVDGVMLVGGAHNQNLINLLRSKNVPFVCSWASDLVLPSVGFDNYASARLLANYLMDLDSMRKSPPPPAAPVPPDAVTGTKPRK
jgi:LacI family transcriptional regulator